MYAKSLFTLAFAFCTAVSASAEELAYQAQVTFAAGQQGQLMVPLPAADRGAPDSMTVRMSVSLRGFAAVENTTKNNGQAVLVTNFGADLNTGGQSQGLGSSANFHRMGRFDSFDGQLDFRGASARLFDQGALTEGARGQFEGKEMARILRNNQAKGLRFTVTGGANISLLGLEYAALQSDLQLFVEVEVTYGYDEEPIDAPDNTPPASPKDPAPTALPAKQASALTVPVSNRR